MEKIKRLFKSAGTKNGTYSVGVTVIVIAIVVVANMVFGQIPEKYRNIDVSSTKIYDISDTSKKLLKDLDKKVTFTVLAEKEKTDDRIKTFLSKYTALSKNMSVKWIDPVLHPSALTDYNAQANSIVVDCADTEKNTIISFQDIIVMDTSSYYYTGNASESEFDGEGQLTSAVNYVSSDANKKIYRTAGHGEATLSGTVTDLMDKNNYEVEELNMVMTPSVPADCDLLLMYAPTTDLTDDEKKAVRDYLSKGGKVTILLGDTSTTQLPNIASIMKEYGMEMAEGYIADPQRSYQGNYYFIFPQLSLPDEMAEGLSTQMVLVTNARGLNMPKAERDTIETNSFMTSSENAFAVTEKGQTEGSYTLGAVATEEISQGADSEDKSKEDAEAKNVAEDAAKEDKSEGDAAQKSNMKSRFTVISAGSLIDAKITDTFKQLENTKVFMNVVSSNFDGVQNISIQPKSLVPQYNTVRYAGMFGLLVIFGIPLLILAGGLAVWLKRRKA